MKRLLALLVAFAVAALPAAASAVIAVPVPLLHDDGSFENSTPVSLPLPPLGPAALPIPVVEFVAPTADLYALDEVKFFLLQAPADPTTVLTELTYPVTVQTWILAPAPSTDWIPAEPLAADISVSADPAGAWYALDLKDEKLTFTGSVRVGITRRDDAAAVPLPAVIVPVPDMPLNLGLDTSASGFSYLYDPAVVPPTWTLDATGNYGIQASAHLVPAMTCQGFLPPFNKTITMKKGGRTIPLKAFLFDALGAPVTRKVLTAPPLVELLYDDNPSDTLDPIDVTDFVAHPGRCNKGQAFRPERRGKWMYNLKTKKSLPPGTYTVQIESGNGTEYVIDPTCTGTFVIEAPKPPKDKDKGKK
jgi:hypothetical protein